MDELHVGSLMNRSVVTAGTETRLSELVHLMREHRIPSIVVVDASRPVGVVTERNLVRVLGEILDERRPQGVHAGQIMSSPPVVVEHGTPLFDALVLAQSHNTTTLVVVDRNEMLCGVLSHADMAKAYKQIIERQRQIIEQETGFETRRLQEVNEQLRSLSTEDALLGIGNRRSMEVDLNYTHQCAVRYGRAYSVAIYDLDCLNHYNNHYGRPAGDAVLQLAVEHIRHAVRRADRLYRYGGEELLLLLPETGFEGARVTAERIAHELAERNIPHAGSPLGVLTLSGGVATYDPATMEYDDWQAVVDQALQRLAQAKTSGRNRVAVSFTPPAGDADEPAVDPASPAVR